MVRTGRHKRLEGGKRISLYLDAETIAYLQTLENVSRWVREKVKEEREKQAEKAEGQE